MSARIPFILKIREGYVASDSQYLHAEIEHDIPTVEEVKELLDQLNN